VIDARARLDAAAREGLALRRALLEEAARAVERHAPLHRLGRDRQQVDDLLRRGERAVAGATLLRRATLDGLAARLGALSPRATLARGYAVVRREADGQVLTGPAQAPSPTRLRITLRDGELLADTAPTAEEDRP
jgi:exodeoxyribonuclease VII large subunit